MDAETKSVQSTQDFGYRCQNHCCDAHYGYKIRMVVVCKLEIVSFSQSFESLQALLLLLIKTEFSTPYLRWGKTGGYLPLLHF